MTLPSHQECYEKAKAGTAKTLEKFIANFEPDDQEAIDVFREQLAKLLHAWAKATTEPVSATVQD